MSEDTAKRRRGAALEEALLDAAWSELEQQGYGDFTFEAVARRAQTSRPVLYRRWDSRLKLATAAIRYHLDNNPIIVPDLGNVRDELKQLLRRFADRAPPRLMRLMFDMSEDMAAEKTSWTDRRFQDHPLQPVIERAVMRGELRVEQLTPRMLQLPTSLVLLEGILTQRRVDDSAIEEIIDEIFLPVARAESSTECI
ncbi:TetR family transcriptional regulator [Sphingobium lactosutens]|uniref:TetR/AcrR family transcriptional regulator n=1 Tax=Sphingobium lactosutens TaxID=522773 RepID=UPI0015B82657|nr:TetR/AcrR family transcriptional regulator [Sphingobium lactosutens]NWK94576.1 TetR family transcriptional regulator [Sphingobium lactosutens]